MKLSFRNGQIYHRNKRIGFVTDLKLDITYYPKEPMGREVSFKGVITCGVLPKKIMKDMQYTFKQDRKRKK